MSKTIRTIVFVVIIIICIFAINYGVYWQFFRKQDEQTQTEIAKQETQTQLAENFKNIFTNTIDYQGNDVNITGLTKIDSSKDLIYTWVSKQTTVENKYELNLNIPRVNISNSLAEKFNEKIKETYVAKANEIILNSTASTVYTIEYASYVNTNILSLVIKATLKEGNNPQRVMVQTFNYNLSTNEEITLKQMLEIKGLQENAVSNAIAEEIQNANTEASTLKNMGYNVYLRDATSDIYNIENTNNFILGANNYLYIIYPYGNINYTDEMDVIVF